ncbi:MAG TPA: hypothetical protein VHT51_04760 [Micropepsaceae bacterium]|jgi:hypothetical protein|nr:hypothetical protein [Micropepsaceae bacterium]
MRRLTIALAGLMAFGLAHGAHAAEATPADWIEVAAGPMFTVKAPPGTTFERIRTGDAFAGTFHGPGFDLPVEFGYHRDAVKLPEGAKNTSETKLVVDEKPGAITKAATADPAHPLFIGLYVPAVENDLLGPLSLVVSGAVAKPEDQALVERIYRTVKFGYKN